VTASGKGSAESAPPSDSKGREEVVAAIDAFTRALNAADYEGVVGMMTEDARFWPVDSPEMAGKERARAAYAALEGFRVEARFDVDEVLVSGDLAVVLALETFRLEPRGGGEPIEIRNRRAFSVWRRDGGVWKSARGMTNWAAPRPKS
jgi:uncharacterized protein (TIGR02246 family)